MLPEKKILTLAAAKKIAEAAESFAAGNNRTTKDFETGLAGGGTSLLKLDILPYEDGIQIAADGAIVGAIGVSGCTPAQDGQVAQAGVDWLRNTLQ